MYAFAHSVYVILFFVFATLENHQNRLNLRALACQSTSNKQHQRRERERTKNKMQNTSFELLVFETTDVSLARISNLRKHSSINYSCRHRQKLIITKMRKCISNTGKSKLNLDVLKSMSNEKRVNFMRF